MSSFQGDELYQTQPQIVAAMEAAIQSVIPDVWLGEDGVITILFNVQAGAIEGLYLANQIVLQDMFIQTATVTGLQLWGDMLNVPQGPGTISSGTLVFSGKGGTYIPIGTEVGLDPGGGADILNFATTLDATIPNPGIATALTAAAGASGGLTGTFEYVVTFITPTGETVGGAESAPITVSAKQISLTTIPLGGPGTSARNIYRSSSGGAYQLVATINDNTTTTLTDNNTSPGTQNPPTVSNAEQIAVTAQSEQSGKDYNAIPGAINILVNAPDGITGVINQTAFTGGSDPEDIDSYRTRLLNWIRGPQTGSALDLQNWALTIEGIASATVFPNYNGTVATPGYVTVMVAGPGGAPATSDQIAEVQALLASKTLANITVVVQSFTATAISISVTIVPASGYLTTDLTPAVRQAITDYVNSVPIAGVLYITGIIAAVVAVPGVIDVTVTTPSSNQTAAAQHKFVPNVPTVSGTP